MKKTSVKSPRAALKKGAAIKKIPATNKEAKTASAKIMKKYSRAIKRLAER